MKKMILPLGIMIAVAFASCDRRATMVEPKPDVPNEELALNANTIAGTWQAVEYERKPMKPGAMSLTAVPNSATTGQATITITQDGKYDSKAEMVNYTISQEYRQVVFNPISSEENSLNGSWNVVEVTPYTLHINNTNGTEIKFNK
jgi:hypothetical protein